MRIFAHGAGMELVAPLACESPQSAGELEPRLERLRQGAKGAAHLQACEGALSGALLAACVKREGELAAPGVAPRRAALWERLSLAQGLALTAVERAAAPDHQAQIAHEVEQSGTAREARGLREVRCRSAASPHPGAGGLGPAAGRAVPRARWGLPAEAKALRQTQRAQLPLRETWSAWAPAERVGLLRS